MDSILELLNSNKGHQIISGISKETHQSQEKTTEVISMALPILLGALKRNTNTNEGASGLLSALDSKHDGSILDNLGSYFEGGVSEDEKADGLGILGHILGGSQDNVLGALSKKSGMDTQDIMKILQVVAPLVLGYLGSQKQKQQVQSPNDLGDLLGNLMGGQNSNQSMIESLLDGNNDGSIIDDVAGMFLNNGNKGKGSIGGMLGGLFGGK